MDILLLICFLGFFFSAILLIRNQMVYKAQLKAIEITSRKAQAAINNWDFNWQRFYKEMESFGSYDRMLFDLTKWRYADFYPGWE